MSRGEVRAKSLAFFINLVYQPPTMTLTAHHHGHHHPTCTCGIGCDRLA